MCKRLTIKFLLFLPLLFSCTEQEELTTGSESGIPQDNTPAGVARVAFKSGPQPQCVYIFRKDGNDFRYDSMINSGWSADGKMTARLLVGEYKFLFTGPADNRTSVLPATLSPAVTIEQLYFAAQTDNGQPNGILPVGELYLPTPDVADSVYTIRGGDDIECTLQRRVSQLTFAVRRGYKGDDGSYIPLPYEEGHNILERIKELRVEISGVARQCNYLRTSGGGTIYGTYNGTEAAELDEQGFATFTGPFVFPSATKTEADLKITPVSASGEALQTLELSGKLEANRQLEVNLWLNPSNFDIGITINTLPITDRTDGDAGIWE